MEIDIRASFELENIIAKKDKTAALIDALTPIVTETPQAPDYSKIPYLAVVPRKIREKAIYDAIDIFSGKGNRLGAIKGDLIENLRSVYRRPGARRAEKMK